MLVQKLKVSCISDDDPEHVSMMKKLLWQDFTETSKSHAMDTDDAQGRVDLFNSGSDNVIAQGKSESDELSTQSRTGYQSETGSCTSSLSSGSDSSGSESTFSSDDDSSTSSSSSGSEPSQKH